MIPAHGEIWLVDLDPSLHDELKKTRPVVVVSHDSIGILNLRVIVPITAWQNKFESWEWLVKVDCDGTNGLAKTSAADTFQVRSLSAQRFVKKLGRISESDLERIKEGLKAVFDID